MIIEGNATVAPEGTPTVAPLVFAGGATVGEERDTSPAYDMLRNWFNIL